MTAPVTLAEFQARLRQLIDDAQNLGLKDEERCLRLILTYFETEQVQATREIEALMKAAAK